MKQYPSIQRLEESSIFKNTVFVFDKIDGSNIRAEYNPKKGLYKFGSRHRLISEQDPLGKAIPLIKQFEESFSKLNKTLFKESAVLFFEFFGPSSKFGSHDFSEKHTVKLIDVSVYKKGLISPQDLINYFGYNLLPEVLRIGSIDHDFLQSVKDGTLPKLGREGVVIKTNENNPKMFKYKRQSWYDELKVYCNNDQSKFDLLK